MVAFNALLDIAHDHMFGDIDQEYEELLAKE